MHPHPRLQTLLALPSEITPQTSLNSFCPLCQSELHLTALQGLACSTDPWHFNIRVGSVVFLRPLSKLPFQVIINYRTHLTKVELYRGKMEHLLTIPEIVSWEELTEDNLKIWTLLT